MKIIKKITGIVMITIIGAMILLNSNYTYTMDTYTMSNKIVEKVKEIETTEDKVKETFVFAKIIKNSPYYNNYSYSKKKVGNFKKDEIVEVIRDRSCQWYLVKAKDGKCGWISKNAIYIPEDPETNNDKMSKDEIENFVNFKGIKSDTPYLVWVDIDRQLTHIFLGKEGKWKLHKTMLSATGKNISPTIKGTFKIQDRGKWFYTERLKSGAKYWVRFNGPYLFHSFPMDKQRNIIDNTLGERASSGCIRLSMEDSKWFYDYVKKGSTVFVN